MDLPFNLGGLLIEILLDGVNYTLPLLRGRVLVFLRRNNHAVKWLEHSERLLQEESLLVGLGSEKVLLLGAN